MKHVTILLIRRILILAAKCLAIWNIGGLHSACLCHYFFKYAALGLSCWTQIASKHLDLKPQVLRRCLTGASEVRWGSALTPRGGPEEEGWMSGPQKVVLVTVGDRVGRGGPTRMASLLELLSSRR